MGKLMKLLLLSDPNSSHTIKWAISLAKNGIEIVLLGLGGKEAKDYSNKNLKIIFLDIKKYEKEGSLSKVAMLRTIPEIKKIIKKFKPDILHAHYASSYGLVGALAGFHPFVLSVWGSDVYSFPHISFLHKAILQFNLRKADKILSTSHVMAGETSLYTPKKIEVTPFGINLKQFFPQAVENVFEKDCIVIGTVKTLEPKYGIEYLIRAFKCVVDKYAKLPLRLLIVGGGSLLTDLTNLVKSLQIEEKTIFTGKIPFNDVAKYQNMLSISVSVSVSDSESFGVAVLEAQACGKPVVVSDVGGLPEVVNDGITGIIVPPADVDATANAIEKLVVNRNLRERMGGAGRERVKKHFNWNENVKQMMDIYEQVLK
jgi:glycosyltransferase involved in cell wall biosynthesis